MNRAPSQAGSEKKLFLLFLAALYGACIGIAAVSHLASSGIIYFPYSDANQLGIRSLVIINHYPKQQDIFWYIFGIGLPFAFASVGAILVKAEVKKQSALSRPGVWMWSLGFFLVQSPFILVRTWFGWPIAILHISVLVCLPFVLSRLISNGDCFFPQAPPNSEHGKTVDLIVRFVLPFIALFIIFWNPSYPRAGIDMVDEGQHLAWMEAILRGRWPGAETAQKYGPLLEWVIYGIMLLKGMTIGALRFISAASQLIAAAISLSVVMKITKSRLAPLVGLAAILCFNSIKLSGPGQFFTIRGAFPLTAMLAFGYQGNNRRTGYFISGVLTAVSLGIAVEFGVAALLGIIGATALEGLAEKQLSPGKLARNIAPFLLGMAVVIIPFLAVYAAHGSLGLFITQYTDYMNAFRAGYLNLPFPPFPSIGVPSFLKWLTDTKPLMYLPPAIYLLAAVELLARRLAGCWNRQATLRSAVLLFGIVSFRSALGRSDFEHVSYSSFAASVIFIWELECAVSLTARWWRGNRKSAGILFPGAWTAVCCAALAIIIVSPSREVMKRFTTNLAGWHAQAAHEKWAREGWVELDMPGSGGAWVTAEQARAVKNITSYIIARTKPNDPIFIIPAHGAYYLLTHRESASPYDIAQDAATAAQRNRVASELRKKMPLVIVFLKGEIDVPFVLEHAEEVAAISETHRAEGKVEDAFIFIPK